MTDTTGIFGRRVVGLLLCATALGHAAGTEDSILTNAPPAWVRECGWERPETQEDHEDSDGVRVLLSEQQENPVLKEAYVRSVRLLESDTGVQDSGSLTWSFDPSYQRLIIHSVRVHRGDAVLDRLDMDELKVIQPESGLPGDIYTGQNTAVLFVEDLRVGDVLEYSYTLRGGNPVIGDHFSSIYPTRTYSGMDRYRIRVVWPLSRELSLRTHLTEQAPLTNAWGEGLEYLWDFEDVESLDYEDYQPAGSEVYPHVEFSDFEAWSRVVDWALPLYSQTETNLGPETEELLVGWRNASLSVEHALLAALEFVQDELRYTGLELGPDSYRPSAPAETLDKRFGDCKAKSLLFCTLARRMGVKAWPALVNTSSREGVSRRLPSPFAFNHVIVKLVMDGQPIWVDPTLSLQGGTLRNRYVPPYGKALLIKEGVTDLEDISQPASVRRLQKVTSNFTVSDYRSPAVYKVTTIYHGGEADDARGFFAGSILKDVSDDYLNYYARYYPGITNPGPLKVNDDRERNRLTVVESYQIQNLWNLNESSRQWEASFYPDSLIGMLTEPFTRLRKMPLRITYPLRKEQSVTIRLPDEEWDFESETETIEDLAFRFTSRREGEGSVVRFRYECETLRPEIPAAHVATYLRKVDEMDELLGDTLFTPDDRPGSVFERLNWLMVVVAALTAGATLIVMIWFWRRLRTAEPPAIDGAPPLLSEQKLRGLGGWLILVGLGVVLNPFTIAAQIAISWESYFSQDVWQTVAMPQGGEYHALWAPLLVGELMANIVLTGCAVLLVFLYFGKRRAFPKTYIVFMIANFCVVTVDALLAQMIPFLAEQGGATATGEVARAAIPALIWCTYMVKSRRVKLTFVR